MVQVSYFQVNRLIHIMEKEVIVKYVDFESQIMKIHYVSGITASLCCGCAHHYETNYALFYESRIRECHCELSEYCIRSAIGIHSCPDCHPWIQWIKDNLLEFRQNISWENGVTVFTLVAMIALIAYGTRTIIIANGLG